MLSRLSIASAAALMVVLSGCGSDSSMPLISQKNFVMDLGEKMPFPTNLLFLPTAQESADGTLNLPYDPDSASAGMIKALNQLDGFSTTSPIVIPTNTVVDPSTLFGRVHLYEVEYTYLEGNPLPMPLRVKRELDPRSEYSFLTKDEAIVLVPKAPLAGGSDYVVVVDRGVYDLEGDPLTPNKEAYLLFNDDPLFDESGAPLHDLDPTTLKRIEQLRPYYHQILQTVGKDGKKILAAFSFKTQTIGAVAKNLIQDDYDQATLILQDSGYTSKQLLMAAGVDGAALKDNAQIYVGVLKDAPYYLGVPSAQNPVAPLTTQMELHDFDPAIKAKLTIPVLASVPKNCHMPQEGWPVVIFQHGITQNRTNLLPLAQTYADICYAAVAIDLPLHGITDPDSPLYMAGMERTFDVDYVTQDEECNLIALSPDGKPDCSGTHYINLQNPAISRDNMRQSVGDLVALTNALGRAVGVRFDPSKVAYVGHSLGAMTPYGYMAHKQFDAAVLANPGGGIIQLLMHSQAFGPIIKEALASAGIEEGSPQFDQYTLISQTLIDDADPINYAKEVGQKQRSLVFEVVGDSVIPNSVLGYPLSGTDPLIAHMRAKNILSYEVPGLVRLDAPVVYSKFAYGTHSSFLMPAQTPEVTVEMHKEMASFIKSDGYAVLVEDLSVLAE
ncbi:MAG: hypothetical protein C6H99_05755 [Epsilonproteobacteria bacterium]|nr:hypothetical protein [Campylobacterota bacterium]NPA64282.1 hypothetical protein [Campylobacterota bacterium]